MPRNSCTRAGSEVAGIAPTKLFTRGSIGTGLGRTAIGGGGGSIGAGFAGAGAGAGAISTAAGGSAGAGSGSGSGGGVAGAGGDGGGGEGAKDGSDLTAGGGSGSFTIFGGLVISPLAAHASAKALALCASFISVTLSAVSSPTSRTISFQFDDDERCCEARLPEPPPEPPPFRPGDMSRAVSAKVFAASWPRQYGLFGDSAEPSPIVMARRSRPVANVHQISSTHALRLLSLFGRFLKRQMQCNRLRQDINIVTSRALRSAGKGRQQAPDSHNSTINRVHHLSV